MSGSNGYDVAINYMQSPLQFMLPIKHEGDMQSWAHSASDRISRYEKEGGFANKLIARLEALVFPFISSCSVLQKSGTTSTSLTNYLLSHQHKDESISKEARELFLLIGALFYSVVIWLPSLFDPTILTRPERQPKPPTTNEEEVDRMRLQVERLQAENITAKQDAIAITFPVIKKNDPTRLEEVIELLRAPEMNGISLEMSQAPEDSNYRAISRAFWGTKDGESFIHETTKCPTILAEEPRNKRAYDASGGYEVVKELARPDFVINPEGMITLVVDCSKISPKNLKVLLEKKHEVGQLVLRNINLELLLDLDEHTSILTQIHSLVLPDIRAYGEKAIVSLEQVTQISERFPRIACFDLRDSRLDNVPDELGREHIVFYTDYRIEPSGRAVSQIIETPHDNVLEKLNQFNAKVFAIVNKDRLDAGAPLEISGSFPSLGLNQRFHCMDFCVTKLSFLRGTDVRSSHLKSFMPKLSYSFPNLKVFDLGNCTLLDCDTFQHLGHFPVKNLYLNGCDAIFGRRHAVEARDRGNYDRNPDHLFINKRDYLLQLDFVTRGMVRLYEKGTEFIRFDGSKLKGTAYGKQKIQDVDTYEKFVIYNFRRSLFPEMDYLSQPPLDKKVKVVFSDRVGHEGIGGF